jgi:multidrug efflux pump subunit AcrA (membrane-fusion protein)
MNAINSIRMRSVRSRWAIGAVAVAVLIALWWLTLGRGNPGSTAAGNRAADTGTSMAGMNNTPVGEVQFSAAQLSQFGVTFDVAKLRTLSTEVRAVGVVTFDEARVAQISPKVAGYIAHLYVNATGQPVSRGQAVAAIYSPELVAAQTELLLAGRLDRAVGQSSVPGVQTTGPSLLTAARQRLRYWDISDGQIDEILRSGKVQRTLTLYSPVSGIVVEKNVVEGQSVTPGAQLMTVADLTTVWVTAELRESDAGSVRAGTAATVELGAFPGQLVNGRVSYVYPTLQAEARTIKARIALPNPGGRIKPGMYATVRLTTPMSTTLTVPASAVIQTGDKAYVFVDIGAGKLAPRDVRLGRRGGEFVEVLSGVNSGERVVTSAQFLLDSESNLAEVMRSMISQGGSSKAGDMKGMTPPPESAVSARKGADLKGTTLPSATRR